MINSYDKLPIGTYIDILAATPQDADRGGILDDLNYQVSILSALSGLTERELLNLPIAEYRDMVQQAAFLTKAPASVKRPADRYVLGDLILKPTGDLRKVTTAQYYDFQAYAPEGDAKLVELLSVFLVPVGHAYGDGYDPLDVQAAIRENLPVSDAIALVAFFFESWLRLTQDTLRSLEKEARSTKRIRNPKQRAEILERIAQTKRDLTNSLQTVGAGLQRLTS